MFKRNKEGIALRFCVVNVEADKNKQTKLPNIVLLPRKYFGF